MSSKVLNPIKKVHEMNVKRFMCKNRVLSQTDGSDFLKRNQMHQSFKTAFSVLEHIAYNFARKVLPPRILDR